MAKSKLVNINKKISDGVTSGYKKIENCLVEGYKKIEDGVIEGYKKIENGVVSGFTHMTDKFVDEFLTSDGESVEDAKKRIAAEQAQRNERNKKSNG